MKRILRLRSECLTELTVDELGGVVGAAQIVTEVTCPVLGCLHTEEIVDLRSLRDCVTPPTTPQNCNTLVC